MMYKFNKNGGEKTGTLEKKLNKVYSLLKCSTSKLLYVIKTKEIKKVTNV